MQRSKRQMHMEDIVCVKKNDGNYYRKNKRKTGRTNEKFLKRNGTSGTDRRLPAYQIYIQGSKIKGKKYLVKILKFYSYFSQVCYNGRCKDIF